MRETMSRPNREPGKMAGGEQGNDWENPLVVGRNKEPGHVPLTPYPDEETALTGDREASSYFKLLNGEWQFEYIGERSEHLKGL